MELTELTATEAARLIANRELSSVELTRACLDRITARNPEVLAFRHLDPDFSLAEAAKADQCSAKSPLHGVPFAVKDVIDTKDFPTECGTRIHAGRRPSADATCVSLMRDAGAVLLGKVVTTEYALFHPNETRHPMDLERTPGGSSSGTGAAVCDRMVPIAFGNQTAGSLIRPAAFCGVYGLKPTHGTTDGTGILPLQLYFDTLGYMARSIADIQAFYSIVSRRDQHQMWPSDKRPKIGLCETFQWKFASNEAREVLNKSAERFTAFGADVKEFVLPEAYANLVNVHRRVLYAGIARSLDADYGKSKDLMSEEMIALLEEGRATSDVEYGDAFAYADQCRENVNKILDDYDAIICPSAPGEAPIGSATGNPVFQVTWTLLGVPCLNLPVGIGPNGMPLGIQLIGHRGDDDKVLALGDYLMRNFETINLQKIA